MTNFNNKIKEQLRILSFSDFNDSKEQYHSYADIAELICLRANGYVSANDVLIRIKAGGQIIQGDQQKFDGELGLPDAEESDTEESWMTVVFEYLNLRSKIYSDSYPFIVEKNGLKIKSKHLTNAQKIYVYLLIASSLDFFNKIQNELTSEFEILSEFVLKQFLPQATVYGFGSNSCFTGNARTKIKALATIINLDIRERVISQISRFNSKEEGLDIVGWISFEDKNPNTIIILGQCACGQNWISKQNETKRYDRFYDSYILPFIHTLFLPHDLRNNSGRFEMDKDININTFVFERRRIIEYSKNFDFNDNFKSKIFIDKCLEYQEDVV
jgi:hypothetical protein